MLAPYTTVCPLLFCRVVALAHSLRASEDRGTEIQEARFELLIPKVAVDWHKVEQDHAFFLGDVRAKLGDKHVVPSMLRFVVT